MARKTVTVTRETTTGRNTGFVDTQTGKNMTRPQFVKQIERGAYPEYHVRVVNGVKTPASNPDSRRNNNLGELREAKQRLASFSSSHHLQILIHRWPA